MKNKNTKSREQETTHKKDIVDQALTIRFLIRFLIAVSYYPHRDMLSRLSTCWLIHIYSLDASQNVKFLSDPFFFDRITQSRRAKSHERS